MSTKNTYPKKILSEIPHTYVEKRYLHIQLLKPAARVFVFLVHIQVHTQGRIQTKLVVELSNVEPPTHISETYYHSVA